ncbi:MAG: ADP-L-glycero-D-manno-heptose 6-epimerase [Saprospiraceae bacterium]|jgi:ADP-L-glycero-D-manno-heptose 6-epimerase
MIVVTGGAGFIGSNIVKGFNEQGRTDILVVDDLSEADKALNLSDCRFADYMDKGEFLDRCQRDKFSYSIDAIFHEGACSDTMATDGQYVMENNFSYSKHLYEFCSRHKTQFIYASSASVYGAGSVFKEHPDNERPLNAYAFSKYVFDNYVRENPPIDFQAVGLRYFNVYGYREQHKGRMASVAYHFYNQFQENASVRLFKGVDGYANGEQLRDFISVEDVVSVNQYLLDHPEVKGFLNVGTGQCRSFNDVALATINACLKLRGEADEVTLDVAISSNLISYIPMPEALLGKYQSYTQADIAALKDTGYNSSFYDVKEGVERYINKLAS